MSRAVEVPVTPSVLAWAIGESGLGREQLAHSARVPLDVLESWLSGQTKPTLTQARKLATKLHRPLAALLLPEPPQSHRPSVQFRRSNGQERLLNPDELRYLRRAARFKDLLSWVAQELHAPPVSIPRTSTQEDPGLIGQSIRQLLGVSPDEQRSWGSASEAFDQWRTALERVGIAVFLFSMGKESCQGFSLWDDFVPVIAVNTSRNEGARIFTLFHELGHLVTRTDSACIEPLRAQARVDPVERWCERFAAGVLMPAAEIRATLGRYGWKPNEHVTSLRVASSIANTYKVSLRAAVIRIIELGAATWTLYDEIPPISDAKPPGGGGKGRNRTQIREDQLGPRVGSLLAAAVERDVLSRSQAVDALDIPDIAFDGISTGLREAGDR